MCLQFHQWGILLLVPVQLYSYPLLSEPGRQEQQYILLQ
jgi:hypothetical protein